MADDDRELLQRFMDSLFAERNIVTRLDAVLRAEALDLPDELVEIVELLPPITMYRQQVADQLNSALKGHGWNSRFGSVE
jgi:hypothetical protein